MVPASHHGRISLDTAEVEEVVAAMRGAGGASVRSAVRSRLRDLQKRGFPAASRVGRGKRSVYNLEELLKIVIAMELVDLDLSSARTIAIVDGSALTLLRFAVLGWRIRRIRAESASPEEFRRRTLALRAECVILPKALADSAREVVLAETPAMSVKRSRDSRWAGRRGRIQLKPEAIIDDLAEALITTFRYTEAELDDAFVELGSASFGADDQAAWTLASLGAEQV